MAQGASVAVFFITAAVWNLWNLPVPVPVPVPELEVSSTAAPPRADPGQVRALSFVELSSVEM